MKLWGLNLYEISLILFALIIGLFFSKYFFLTTFVLMWSYMISTKRIKSMKRFAISTIIALVWIIIANNFYSYNQDFLIIFGFATFPFFGLSIGLYGIHMLFSILDKKLKKTDFKFRFILFCFFFWVILLISESCAYNFFNVHNITSTTYTGIKFCNCIHAPIWMKLAYFLFGPIFYLISKIFNVEKF